MSSRRHPDRDRAACMSSRKRPGRDRTACMSSRRHPGRHRRAFMSFAHLPAGYRAATPAGFFFALSSVALSATSFVLSSRVLSTSTL